MTQLSDLYYKSSYPPGKHQQVLAAYIQDTFDHHDLKELSVNDALKLFRGLFFMEGLGGKNSINKFSKIYVLYEEFIRERIDKLNVSTLLSVIETCRYAGAHGHDLTKS